MNGPAKFNGWEMVQGAVFTTSFDLEAAGEPVDLTGWVAEFQFWNGEGNNAVQDLLDSDEEGGVTITQTDDATTITITATPEQTADTIPARPPHSVPQGEAIARLPYNFFLRDPDGNRTCWMTGTIALTRGIAAP